MGGNPVRTERHCGVSMSRWMKVFIHPGGALRSTGTTLIINACPIPIGSQESKDSRAEISAPPFLFCHLRILEVTTLIQVAHGDRPRCSHRNRVAECSSPELRASSGHPQYGGVDHRQKLDIYNMITKAQVELQRMFRLPCLTNLCRG